MRVDPYDGRGWLGMAKLYERRQQLSKARETLVEGLSHSPQNAFLLQALGCLEAKTGNLPEAHRRFQQVSLSLSLSFSLFLSLSLALSLSPEARGVLLY
jgi:predicted Zn-dependent protease